MRLVGIKSLKDGDILAASVQTSSGKKILNTGAVLSELYISKFVEIGIQNVFIQDNRFNDVEIIELIDLEIRNDVIGVLKDAYKSFHKTASIDEYKIKVSAKKIVDYVKSAKNKGVSILSTDAIDEYIIEHSLNVAVLTAFLGTKMGYTFNKMCDLVAGALIHDLGRANVKGETEFHVQKGFDVLRRCRGLSLLSSIVAYQHHENFDGSGYPRNLKGTAINEFSRIVRVADYYDNALHGYDTEDKNKCIPIMPHQAYESILAVSSQILDPEIVRIFREAIVFYPNGSTVMLGSDAKAIVVRQNNGFPQRPVVRVYNDEKVLEEIDLTKNLTNYIVEVLVL